MPENVIIKSINQYIQLNDIESNYFLSLLNLKTINRKEYLLRPNEVCKYESFITKGCLRSYTIDEAGLEHIVMFGVEDWWIGDLYSFLTQTPSNFIIDALEDTDVLQISKDNLEKYSQMEHERRSKMEMEGVTWKPDIYKSTRVFYSTESKPN